MSLFDFEEVGTLEIVREKRVTHPDDDRSELIGYTGVWGDGTCYLSPRNREEHYFRKLDGYAISVEILHTVLLADMVRTVFIAERDTGTVYEFDTSQFKEGLTLNFDGHDPQRLVPVAEARRKWDKSEVTIK